MKYAHINLTTNELIGWYSLDVHDSIPEPNIEVTDEQWQFALNNDHNKVNEDGTTEQQDFSTQEEKEQAVRENRNTILVSVVDPIVSNPLRWNDLTETEKAEIATYRTELLDITEQASFPEVTWPTQPEVLDNE
jgi:hypothetical protein